jgi:hypothetical protein
MIDSMARIFVLVAALAGWGLLLGAAPASSQGSPVRLWVEENTDIFYPSDPVSLRFRVFDDAYVAVVHLDTRGNLELLFPESPWADEFVRGARTYRVGGPAGRLRLGGAPGIGYFYVIASPYPLDLRFFRARTGAWSDGAGLGRVVRGDPFWTLEQLTALLSPDWRAAPVAVDVFSYHLGGRHRFPSYACYDRGVGGAHPYYPSCDRLQRLLGVHPNYYDTRRFRGDRGMYLRELDDLAPRHGLKEPIGRYAPGTRDVERPIPRGQAAPPPVGQQREGSRAEPQRGQRPVIIRRGEAEERAEPRRANPPAREAPAQREAPQRESPPPAREAPPQRESPPPTREREEVRPEPRRSPPRDGERALHDGPEALGAERIA